MNMNSSQKIKSTKVGNWFSRNKSIIPWVLVVLLVIAFIALWNKDPEVIIAPGDNSDLIREKKELEDRNQKTWSVLQQVVLTQAETNRRNDSLARALNLKPKYIQGRDEYHYETFIKVDTIRTT